MFILTSGGVWINTADISYVRESATYGAGGSYIAMKSGAGFDDARSPNAVIRAAGGLEVTGG